MIIFFAANVSAIPPVQISSNTGMQIEYPPFEFIKLGTAQRFHVHVINETTAKTNKTTSCFIHLYNQTGWDIGGTDLILEGYNGVDFAATLDAGNFSTNGIYAWVIQCNATNEIAFAAGSITVSPLGKEFTIQQSILDSIIFIIAILIFIGLIVAGVYLPSGNHKDSITGYISSVNNLKYLRILCFAFAYLVLMLIMYFAWMMCFAQSNLIFLTDLFRVAFWTQVYLIVPLFIVGVIIVIIHAVEDSKVAEALGMNLRIK